MTPAENSEKQPKKPIFGKILYGVTVGLLSVVMIIATLIYLGESLPQEPEETAPTGMYIPTFREPTVPAPTAPTAIW